MCSTDKGNNFKLLICWYHIPSLLHKLYPDIPHTCWRCYILLVLGLSLIYDVLGLQGSLDPLLFLLNVISNINLKPLRMMLHIFTAARYLIVLFWKRNSPSTLFDLLTHIKEARNLEHMNALLNNQMDLFILSGPYGM